MELLLLYADRLHAMGLIDEMHIWDFSRDERDSRWLKETFQRSPFVSISGYEYRSSGLTLEDGGSAALLFRCGGGAHVLLVDPRGNTHAEISLGAYGNSCSFLRDGVQGRNISAHGRGMCDAHSWKRLELTASEGEIMVSVDGCQILRGRPHPPSFPMDIRVAAWNGEEVHWRIADAAEKGRKHPYARLFPVKNKSSWLEYYRHYTPQLYPDSVVMKSDDDIVFIDVDSFGKFIEDRIMDEDSLLLFPGIVNNGVCARHQASCGIIPNSIGEFKGEGSMNTLWWNGGLCGELHRSFTQDHEEWIERARCLKDAITIPIGERISINFFAILSKDLYAFQMIGGDDERDITIEVTRKLGRYNSIRLDMTVAHLSFYKQRETGLDEKEALGMYRRLARDLLGKRWEERML